MKLEDKFEASLGYTLRHCFKNGTTTKFAGAGRPDMDMSSLEMGWGWKRQASGREHRGEGGLQEKAPVRK